MLHIIVHICAEVLLPITGSFLFYSCRFAFGGSALPEYTSVVDSLFSSDAISYVVLALNVVSFAEVLTAAVAQTFFIQDRGLQGLTLWTANTWFDRIARMLVCIFGQLNFVVIPMVFLSYIRPG